MTASTSLPDRPSLESLRKQAKKLARDIAAGDRAAIARARAMAPASPAAMSRASFLACLRRESRDGRGGSGFRAVMATSFINQPVPAAIRPSASAASLLRRDVSPSLAGLPRAKADERRCTCTRLGRNRWECSLAAGRWRPVSALGSVYSPPVPPFIPSRRSAVGPGGKLRQRRSP